MVALFKYKFCAYSAYNYSISERHRSFFCEAAFCIHANLQHIIWACMYVCINVSTYFCACMCVEGNTLSHLWVEGGY